MLKFFHVLRPYRGALSSKTQTGVVRDVWGDTTEQQDGRAYIYDAIVDALLEEQLVAFELCAGRMPLLRPEQSVSTCSFRARHRADCSIEAFLAKELRCLNLEVDKDDPLFASKAFWACVPQLNRLLLRFPHFDGDV